VVSAAASGYAKIFLMCDDEAVALLRRAIKTNRNYPMAHFWLATALAHLGRPNEAVAAVQAGFALNPTFTISRARANAQRERIFDGMRRAGVPEG
jgi:hypothetical protein